MASHASMNGVGVAITIAVPIPIPTPIPTPISTPIPIPVDRPTICIFGQLTQRMHSVGFPVLSQL